MSTSTDLIKLHEVKAQMFFCSSDFILPSVGTGTYDLSSSYHFITSGLRNAAELGVQVCERGT
jgi:hypothetical protein